MEKKSWRRDHEGATVDKKSWNNIEEKSWRRNPGTAIVEKSWGKNQERNHQGEIMKENK